jgi:RsiW-degrading membrane proteinase PrsW (M82 family)
MNNAIGVLFQYSMNNGWGIDRVMDPLMRLFSSSFGFIFTILFVIGMYWLMQRIIHMFARENYLKEERVYIAKFMHENPGYIAGRIERGESTNIDDIAAMVRVRVRQLSRAQQTRFFLETHHKPQKMTALEGTFFWGILILGTIVTVMTFAWGLL